jgi:hypothetical protein
MIREIQITLPYETAMEKKKKFIPTTYCTGDFFLRLLDKFAVGKIQKLIIECSESEVLKTSNPSDDSIGVIVLRRHIDLSKYFSMSVKEKKKWTLRILVDGFKELNQYYEFSFEKIEAVAKTIKDMDYLNHYRYGKVVSSPSKKMKAQLWVEHEIDKFHLFVDILNPEEELITREKVISTFPNWVAYLPVLGSIKWETDQFISIIPKNKKVVKKIKVKPLK